MTDLGKVAREAYSKANRELYKGGYDDNETEDRWTASWQAAAQAVADEVRSKDVKAAVHFLKVTDPGLNALRDGCVIAGQRWRKYIGPNRHLNAASKALWEALEALERAEGEKP